MLCNSATIPLRGPPCILETTALHEHVFVHFSILCGDFFFFTEQFCLFAYFIFWFLRWLHFYISYIVKISVNGQFVHVSPLRPQRPGTSQSQDVAQNRNGDSVSRRTFSQFPGTSKERGYSTTTNSQLGICSRDWTPTVESKQM